MTQYLYLYLVLYVLKSRMDDEKDRYVELYTRIQILFGKSLSRETLSGDSKILGEQD
jgi:hypothetical protein